MRLSLLLLFVLPIVYSQSEVVPLKFNLQINERNDVNSSFRNVVPVKLENNEDTRRRRNWEAYSWRVQECKYYLWGNEVDGCSGICLNGQPVKKICEVVCKKSTGFFSSSKVDDSKCTGPKPDDTEENCPCEHYMQFPGVDPRCNDGIKNNGETDIDCGGPCIACSNCEIMSKYDTCAKANKMMIIIQPLSECKCIEKVPCRCNSKGRVKGVSGNRTGCYVEEHSNYRFGKDTCIGTDGKQTQGYVSCNLVQNGSCIRGRISPMIIASDPQYLPGEPHCGKCDDEDASGNVTNYRDCISDKWKHKTYHDTTNPYTEEICKDKQRLDERWKFARNIKYVANSQDVDGVAILGDLTEFGRDGELNTYEDDFSAIETIVYPSLGNHDIGNNLNDCTQWYNGHKNYCVLQMFNYMKKWLKDAKQFKKITDYDPESFAYVYDLDGIRYFNLQFTPAFPGMDFWYSHWTGGVQYFMKSPTSWLENKLSNGNYGGVRAIVLLFHYPIDYTIVFGNTDRWTKGPDNVNQKHLEVQTILVNHNKNSATPNVVGMFHGHLHERLGYWGNSFANDIPHFYTGGAAYFSFLKVDFKEDHYVVYAHYINKYQTPKSSCVNVKGPQYSGCTKWMYNPKSAGGDQYYI